MNINVSSLLKSLVVLSFVGLIVWGCKKAEDTPVTPTVPVDEEVIPGKTVGYGVELLEQSAYEKLPLIAEPMVPNSRNGRIAKDPTLASAYDLTNKMPPVQSQGAQGSCVAWSVGYAARSYFNHLTKTVSYTTTTGAVNPESVFSPAFIYNQIKVEDCQKGSYVVDALNLLKNSGSLTWKEMPYFANDCTTQPTEVQKQAAVNHKIKSWGRINRTVDAFRKFLYYDTPIIISTRLNESFKSYRNTKDIDGQYIWTDASEKNVSYHAMIIVGYDDARKAFKIQNSWGRNWANNGYIWMAYDILPAVIKEAYVMIPGEWPASAVSPALVTEEAGQVNNGQIQLKGKFTTIGDLPIIQYGICVSATSSQPTDRIEIRNTPIISTTQAFSVNASAVGPTLYYRAFAETLAGTVYGNTMSVAIKPGNTGELNQDMLFGAMSYTMDLNTGNKLTALGLTINTGIPGVTLTKTNYLYSEDNSVLSFGITDSKLKWRYAVGTRLHGYPVANDNMVYFSTNSSLVAVDLITGGRKWEYKSSAFIGQPVVRDNRVYFGSVGKGVTCLDGTTGNLIREFPKVCNRNIPTIENGILYYVTKSGIVAYNTNSGQMVWEYSDDLYFYNFDVGKRPIYSEGKLICAGYYSNLSKAKMMAINAADGKLVWEQPTFTLVSMENMSVDGNTLAYTIRTEDNQSKLVVMDINTAQIRWEKKFVSSSYVLPDDNFLVANSILILSDYQGVQAYNVLNGQKIWERRDDEVGPGVNPSFINKAGKSYHRPVMGM